MNEPRFRQAAPQNGRDHENVIPNAAEPAAGAPSGRWTEVFCAFFRLGLTSFGGPAAHLGYFRSEFVERRRWLDEAAYAELIALSQFLPGPASSQTGFGIGLSRAGIAGALAAWAAFTLPSAALMLLAAAGAPALAASAWGAGLLHGLKLAAVAVVAQAVLGMARALCPDGPRAALAVVAMALVAFAPAAVGQIAALAAGAAAGLLLGAGATSDQAILPAYRISRRFAALCLLAYGALLALSFSPAATPLADLGAAFYRSGALVFGGGHVVLPLLREAVVAPGWMSDSAFLTGYGAAQALPGPLFSIAAYLGALAAPSPGAAGAAVALVAIFLPGLLAFVGVLPFWGALRASSRAQSALAGVNAAVVGLLAAALYNPVWTSAVLSPRDFLVAVAGFVALVVWRTPPLLVVAGCALAGVANALAAI